MFEYLEPIKLDEGMENKLKADTRRGSLVARGFHDVQGDYRYWDVDTDQSPLLEIFYQKAMKAYLDKNGKEPKNTVLMINHIIKGRGVESSGGGWHVDSVREQYKAFMYLDNCSNDNGPLTILTSGVKIVDKFFIILNYLLGNKFRFSDRAINNLKKIGFKEVPIVAAAFSPFMVNTSYIHRGAKINIGDRLMATLYMFDGHIPPSIIKRIS